MRIRGSNVLVFVALVVGCAPGVAPAGVDGGMVVGADGSPSGPDGTSNVDAGSTSRFECCIDGAPYRCPDQDAFDQCTGGFDPTCFERCTTPDCFDTCIAMMEMAAPDPSGCFSDATVTCEATSTCSAGTACDYDDDCSSGNCTNGHCWGSSTGCACDYDDDCTSGNCTNSRCEGNGFGSPCDYDDDCTSSNCTDGTCS